MRIRSASLTIASTLLAIAALAAPAAGAATQPTFGAADGVQVTRGGDTLELRFTGASAAGAAEYVGTELAVRCDEHAPAGLLFGDGRSSGSDGTSATVRRADGTVTLRAVVSGSYDTCDVARPYVERVLRRTGPWTRLNQRPAPLARVPLTPAGTTWIDEYDHAVALLAVAYRQPQTPPYALPGTVTGAGVVALPGPDASPGPDEVGYWSDGAAHVAYVTLSGAGRRLLTEDLGHGMSRTNLNEIGSEFGESGGRWYYRLSVGDADPDRTPAARGDGDALGSDDGVRARLVGRRLTVSFTGRSAKAFRAIAGRNVSLRCSSATPDLSGDDPFADATLTQARVPRRGGAVSFRLPAGGHPDVCTLSDDGRDVAAVTPTADGRAVVEDLRAFLPAFDVAELAPKGATAYPTAAAIAAKHPKTLVALARPGAPVPRGRIGVWSDGAQQALLAAESPTGHRLVMADEGNGVVRSNIYNLLLLF